ncbi:MAG: hypothetical protein LBQ09_05135 [Acidobacteriaceae bacterium]|nr:hypothetical protein [Acidobacteriaceae bacterium]
MRVDDLSFLLQLFPALLTIYFIVVEAYTFAGVSERWSATGATVILTAASAVVIARVPYGGWLLAVTALAYLASRISARLRQSARGVAADALGALTITMVVSLFVYIRWHLPGRVFAWSGVTVITCHAIAYLVETARRRETASPLLAGLYLWQFPVLPVGPIVRYDEFAPQHLRLQSLVSLGAFAYGTRRIVIGVIKLWLIAGTLGETADAIFALPSSRLGTGAAWVGALSFSLQIYYLLSGYGDLAIGAGRVLGLRYPENFRRPYVAESLRDFWTRWHMTALAWARDYLSSPIVERQRLTPRAFLHVVIGFVFLGIWYGATGNLLLWACYSAVCLALEALWLGALIARLPRVARHLSLLAVLLAGWVILRTDTLAAAATFFQAMGGIHAPTAFPVWRFLTPAVWAALFVAVIGAGPMVPWISRWRVTLDAATTATVMMIGAVWVWLRRLLRAAVRRG